VQLSIGSLADGHVIIVPVVPPMTSFTAPESKHTLLTANQCKHYGSRWVELTTQEELGDFEYSASAAYKQICTLFGVTIQPLELKNVVCFVSQFLEMNAGVKLPPLSKNAKRDFPLLVKYVQTNLDVMLPVLVKVQFVDEHRKKIILLDSDRFVRQHIVPVLPCRRTMSQKVSRPQGKCERVKDV
jgi:hypothetical protein